MNNRKLIKSLGPGIMFASTAIGVSHLVQCTRAGADYGFTFLWAILVANVLKYPFFEFGSRYANSTGKSLLHGYKDKGIGWLWLYFGLSLVSMLIVTAAVTFVTAGLFSNLFHLDWNVSYVALGLLLVCGAILISGGFRMLDSLLKIIGVVMLLSTIGAFAMAMIHGPINQAVDFMKRSI